MIKTKNNWNNKILNKINKNNNKNNNNNKNKQIMIKK